MNVCISRSPCLLPRVTKPDEAQLTSSKEVRPVANKFELFYKARIKTILVFQIFTNDVFATVYCVICYNNNNNYYIATLILARCFCLQGSNQLTTIALRDLQHGKVSTEKCQSKSDLDSAEIQLTTAGRQSSLQGIIANDIYKTMKTTSPLN